MHNIGYMSQPENIKRDWVMGIIAQEASDNGDGYSGPMHWHDDLPVYKDREAAEAKIKELDKGWYDDHAVRYYDFSTAQPTKRIGELQAKVRETQMFCKWSGELEAINLYDEDGDFVAEFSSEEELQDFFSKVQPNGCCWEV